MLLLAKFPLSVSHSITIKHGESLESANLNPCGSVLRFIAYDETLLHYEHESTSVFQIQTRLQNLSSNLQNKSNDIEVLAVSIWCHFLLSDQHSGIDAFGLFYPKSFADIWHF